MWGASVQFAFLVANKNLVVVMTFFPNTIVEYKIQVDDALVLVARIFTASN